MKRRAFIRSIAASLVGFLAPVRRSYAKTYVTPEQAKNLIWGALDMVPKAIQLSDDQQSTIENSSGVWVRSKNIKALVSAENHWLIYDTVIGKHENIDLAVGITNQGKVSGVEIMVYRESYGYQIMNRRWLAQFFNKSHADNLKIDRNVVNISGATLSCVHVTDGVNRLTQTWQQVLRWL